MADYLGNTPIPGIYLGNASTFCGALFVNLRFLWDFQTGRYDRARIGHVGHPSGGGGDHTQTIARQQDPLLGGVREAGGGLHHPALNLAPFPVISAATFTDTACKTTLPPIVRHILVKYMSIPRYPRHLTLSSSIFN